MDDLQKQYQIIERHIVNGNVLELTIETYLRCQDILHEMEARGYVRNLHPDGALLYFVEADLKGFEEWLDAKIKESKRLNRREWTIAIVSAIVGALITLIPTMIQ